MENRRWQSATSEWTIGDGEARERDMVTSAVEGENREGIPKLKNSIAEQWGRLEEDKRSE
ncbi:Hypothetical predicted protein, partial [Olea europaea subsp. europaea]